MRSHGLFKEEFIMKNKIRSILAVAASLITVSAFPAEALAVYNYDYGYDCGYYDYGYDCGYDYGYYDYYDYGYNYSYSGDVYVGNDYRYGSVYYGSDIGYYYYNNAGRVVKLGWNFTVQTKASTKTKTGNKRRSSSNTGNASTGYGQPEVVSVTSLYANTGSNQKASSASSRRSKKTAKTGYSRRTPAKKKTTTKTVAGYTYGGTSSIGSITETYYYNNRGNYITMRKAPGNYDVSGDTTLYTSTTSYRINNVTVTFKGFYTQSGGDYFLATWTKGGYSYSVSSLDALSASTLKNIVKALM